MSELSQNKEKAPSLSAEDVISFMKDRGATMKCPICNSQEWLVNEDEPLFTVRHLPHLPMPNSSESEADGGESTAMVLPMIFMNCANCSYVRHHLRSAIQDWKTQQESSDNE